VHRQHHQVTAASSITPRLYDLESADWLMLTHFAAIAAAVCAVSGTARSAGTSAAPSSDSERVDGPAAAAEG
jgi:hypothetical protein